MSKAVLADIVAYICSVYPHPQELSNARLTKLVYLTDWASARVGDAPVTDIKWIFNNYGPWVPDVVATAQLDSRLGVVTETNAYGSLKRRVEFISVDSGTTASRLDARTKLLVDTVIAETEKMYFNEFIDYVYDTEPVKTGERGSTLDLVAVAERAGLAKRPPEAVAEHAWSPATYNEIQDLAQLEARQFFLDDSWFDRANDDGVVFTDEVLLPGSVTDVVTLGADFQSELITERKWYLRVSATIEVSAYVDKIEAREENFFEAEGYLLVDENWDADEALIERSFEAALRFVVEMSPSLDGWISVKLDSAQLR